MEQQIQAFKFIMDQAKFTPFEFINSYLKNQVIQQNNQDIFVSI